MNTEVVNNTRPQLEHALLRDPSLGFEPAGNSVLRCLEHGCPSPLQRWHYHDEYELQIITETYGRTFVGDYIGHYAPGYVALVGPRLPHNWISTDQPASPIGMRNLVIQFLEEPLKSGMAAFPEMDELNPLLERSKHGIEFFGMTEQIKQRYHRIKNSKGMARFAEFVELLLELSRCEDYRLLSTVQMQYTEDRSSMNRINQVLDYLNENYAEAIAMPDVCALVGMSEPGFSRFPQDHRQHLHRFSEWPAYQQGLPAAAADRAAGQQRVLRGGLSQPGQFQPPLPGCEGGYAQRVPQAVFAAFQEAAGGFQVCGTGFAAAFAAAPLAANFPHQGKAGQMQGHVKNREALPILAYALFFTWLGIAGRSIACCACPTSIWLKQGDARA